MCVCVCVLLFLLPLTCNLSEKVELNYIGGADPEMIFLDASDKEVEVASSKWSSVCVFVTEITGLYRP